MLICRPAASYAVAGFFSVGLVFVAANRANAQTTDLQTCATQYQAAKADNKLNGQAWQDFFADCKTHLGAAAPTDTPEAKAPVEPAAAPKNVATMPEPSSEAAVGSKEAAVTETPAAPAKDEKADIEAREKKCRAKWKAEAVDLKKKDPNLNWTKYWKQCSARFAGAKN